MAAGNSVRTSFLSSALDPASHLGEILFGLIMTLTFTLGAGVLLGGGEGASRELLRAALGCNVAWGVIDAALYLLGVFFDRGRLARLGRAIAATNDPLEARALVASELDEVLVPITAEQTREALYDHVATRVRSTPRRSPGLTGQDLIAALVIFVTVVGATLPAAAPFLLIDDPRLALRASNLVLVALLFGVGFRWARFTSVGPWVAGAALMSLGIALVAIAIALGG
ncbi:MAG TPA: hypothetical protein VMJ74_13510 [Pseudomonadales bacterium]|nr:hypothetical protein [Pseudomonadales bacterium]